MLDRLNGILVLYVTASLLTICVENNFKAGVSNGRENRSTQRKPASVPLCP
jgi:hypothetical protein